jgi:peptidyl-prolyl cis-trans isomerase C
LEVAKIMKVSSVGVALCAAFLLFHFTGCSSETDEPNSPIAPAEVGGRSQDDETVLARAWDEEITRDDLEAAFVRMQVPERRRKGLKGKFLDDLVEAKVFAGEARRLGLEKDPEVAAALEKEKDEVLARYFAKKFVDTEAEPPEEELKTYYQEHQKEFVVPRAVLIQRIVVADQELAEEVSKALSEGASFGSLAEKHSIGPNWKKGGQAGWMYEGTRDPKLEKVVFELEKEAVSDIVKAPMDPTKKKERYQIIKVLDKQDKRQVPFEEARSRIRAMFFWHNRKGVVERYYKEAKVNQEPTEAGVLAKVGEKTFTEQDLAPIMAKLSEKGVSEERQSAARQRWIKYWVQKEVFSTAAKKNHLEKDPEVAAELKHRVDDLLAKAFREKVTKFPSDITDKEIEAFYQAHQEEFREPLKLRAKSILVKERQEAEEIVDQLKGGAVFEQLAVKKSLRPSAKSRAGEIGWFGKGEQDPALEKAALAMDKGETSGVIETGAGFEVIKLMDRRGGNIRPLEEVKEPIRMRLVMNSLLEAKERYYKEAGVEILTAKPLAMGQQSGHVKALEPED